MSKKILKPQLEIKMPEYDQIQKRLTRWKIALDKKEVFCHPLGAAHVVTSVIWQSKFEEDIRQRVSYLTIADSFIYGRIFILEQFKNQRFKLADVHSSPYLIDDLMPVIINQYKTRSVLNEKHPYKYSIGFHSEEALLVAGTDSRGEGIIFLLDPSTSRQYVICGEERFAEYRGDSNCYSPRLSFNKKSGAIILHFHSNFIALDQKPDHSVNISQDLACVEFDAKKTKRLHKTIVRAYPPNVSIKEAAEAFVTFYAK